MGPIVGWVELMRGGGVVSFFSLGQMLGWVEGVMRGPWFFLSFEGQGDHRIRASREKGSTPHCKYISKEMGLQKKKMWMKKNEKVQRDGGQSGDNASFLVRTWSIHSHPDGLLGASNTDILPWNCIQKYSNTSAWFQCGLMQAHQDPIEYQACFPVSSG